MPDIQIKGPSLNYILDFINENFPGKKQNWFDNLPSESKKIYNESIYSTHWYDLNLGHVEAIKALGRVFFNGDEKKAAYEMGKFGGRKALSGIYKIFIMIPSLDFVVKKVSTIASTYYSTDVKIEVLSHENDFLILTVEGFKVGQELMLPNISGWIDNLMSIISKQKYTIEFTTTPVGEKISGRIITKFFA